MAEYADIGGVRTWYDRRGHGEPVVLLHGGFTDSRDFTGNLDALATGFRIFLPERRGHGHTPDVDGPLTVDVMAQDTIAFLEQIVGRPARVVGYSAGAIVALHLAVRRPDLVERLVLVSGAYSRDGVMVRPTAGQPPPPPLLEAYAQVSPDGAEHLAVVIDKVARAVEDEPGLSLADLAAVGCRTLVVTGDDDIVSLDHTVELYRGLRQGALAVIPEASHLLLHEKPTQLTQLIADFLTTEAKATWMPLRRAAPPPPEPGLPAELGKPALRALADAGFTRLDQLADLNRTELAKLHGVGPKALRLLDRALSARQSPAEPT